MQLPNKKQAIWKEMLDQLELPESAYEKAISRYQDIGEWFSRKESSLNQYDPHVFSQGSFRLGTAIKPVNPDEEYDLDLSCKLRKGVSKTSHTQEQLKSIVGKELELYRVARRIEEKLEPKHRCWRLLYQDTLRFHADVVPCVPEEEQRLRQLNEVLSKSLGALTALASETTVVITDDRDPNYKVVSDKWKISNPEGYAVWFEDRMKTSTVRVLMEKAQVDEVPTYKRKTPLQQAVQLLKWHRDVMFKDKPELKPISIIITTLAARAYDGELDFGTTLGNILDKMSGLVNANAPRVPNPVDPDEDFADRWAMEKHKNLNLEKNFRLWLEQAKADFAQVTQSDDVRVIASKAKERFSLVLNEASLAKSLGAASVSSQVSASRVQIIDENRTAKPWGFKPE